MVQLNPDVQQTAEPNWLGWSKPITQPRPDLSGKITGEGVGKVIGDVGTIAEPIYKNMVEEDATKKGDALRDEQITQLETALKSVDPSFKGTNPNQQSLLSSYDEESSNVPQDVRDLPHKLDIYNSAKSNGSITSTDYDARVTTLAKDLRSKWPGQRHVIDAALQRSTGREAANDYLRTLTAQLNSFQTKKDKDQDELKSLLSRPEVIGRIPGWDRYMQMITKGDTSAKDEIYKQVNRVYQMKAYHDDAMRDLSESEKGLEVGSKLAVRTAGDLAYKSAATDVANLSDGGKTKITDTISNMEAGKESIDPDRLQNALTMLEQAKAKKRAELLKDWNTPDKDGNSIAKALGTQSNIEENLKKSDAVYDNYIERIKNKDFGLAHRTAQAMEVATEQAGAAILGDGKMKAYISMNKAMHALSGDTSWMTQMTQAALGNEMTPERINGVANILTTKFLGQDGMPSGVPGAPVNTGEPYTLNQMFQEAQRAGIEDPRAYRGWVNMIDMVAKGDTPPKVRAVLERGIYSKDASDFIHSFQKVDYATGEPNRDGSYLVFGKMFSPKATKLEHAEGGEKWQNYKDAAIRSTRELLGKEIGTLRDQPFEKEIKTTYTIGKDGIPTLNAELRDQRPMTQGNYLYQKSLQEKVEQLNKSYNRINMAMYSFSHIAKAEGKDPTAFLANVFFGFGVDPSKLEGHPEQVINAIIAAHGKAEPQKDEDKSEFEKRFGGQ